MSELIADLRKVPVVRPVIPFTAGILLAAYLIPVITDLLLKIGPILFACMIVLPWSVRTNRLWGIFTNGILFLLSFMILGALHYSADRIFRNDAGQLSGQEGYLEGILSEGGVEKANSWMIRLEGVAFKNDSIQVCLDENVQVYLPAEAQAEDLAPGLHLLVWGRLTHIRNDGNPGEFDYAGYMSRKRVRFNVFVRDTAHFRILTGRMPGRGYGPAGLRQRIIREWDRSDPNVAVLSALTLGYKSLLDKQTKSAFSDAGAMHLLAVSGLHVGMIWWILDQLIRLPVTRKTWRGLKLCLIVAILWGYASVTGFSDSVTRSVTMFSLLTFSRSVQRKSNIYNTLFLSAFLLLVLQPSRIMEPGFQLSYIAVAGIVTIQPQLGRLYQGVHRIGKRILDLVSVSIAAQVSTLPLVLTYFHQFPVWFLLTNLAAIPLVSIILALFVLFLPFLVFHPEWTVFLEILLCITGILNQVVTGISSLPGAVITGVWTDPAAMVMWTGLLVSGCIFIYYNKVIYLLLVGLMLSAILVLPIYREAKVDGEYALTIFNQKDATMISYLRGVQRKTYLLPATDGIDGYLNAYVQSLSGIPPGIKSHEIVLLHPNGGSPAGSAQWLLTEGLWAIHSGPWNILIAGDCGSNIFQMAVDASHWDAIILRRGTPLYGMGDVLGRFQGCLLGDGTLREYEMKILSQEVPSVRLTAREGALVIN